ncbi:hypothetical protein [Streptomyces yaizuensis]|uniref:Uncharacterized protein n=1 Tax=Streptomyces yaizuensis TaxID=2989713 RepID=A0AA86IZ76_9ACTN|nr:hypothetical protein [Streptomyces sp. YSPA8]BDT39531.1 hypothetical protein SYYSPA8_37065 [Streptomyces sp. YSPA8]
MTAADPGPDDVGFGPPVVVDLDVDLDGEPLRISLPQPDGMAACEWAVWDDFLALFPGALPPDQYAYWRERMRDPSDPLTVGALQVIAYRVAERVYGVPWWAAHRLTLRAAASWWQFEAWSVTVGFDPRVPGTGAARIVGACWAFVSAGLAAEEVQLLHRELWEPPAGPIGHEARLARGQEMLNRLMGDKKS